MTCPRSKEMPRILTLRCAWCGAHMILRDDNAERAKETYSRNGPLVEYGDVITIGCCGKLECAAKELGEEYP